MLKKLNPLTLLIACLLMALALSACDGRSGSSGVLPSEETPSGPVTTVRTKVALAYSQARGPAGEVAPMAATETDYRSASVKLTLPDGRILVMSYDGAGEYSCKVENLPAGSAGFIQAEFGGVAVRNFFDGLTSQGGSMDTGLTNPDSTLAADALAAFAQALAPVEGGYSVAELLSSVQNATLDIDVAALRTQIEDGQVAGYELARQSYNSILVWDNIDLTSGQVANLIETDPAVETLNEQIANGGMRPPLRTNLAEEAKLVVAGFLDEYMNTRTVVAISPYLSDTDFLSSGDDKPEFMLNAQDEWTTSPKYLNLQSASLSGLSYAAMETDDFTGAASSMFLVTVSGTYDLTYAGPQTVTRSWDGPSSGYYVGKVGGEWVIFGDRMRMWFDYSVGYFNTSTLGTFTELSFELGNSGGYTPLTVEASNETIFGADDPVTVTNAGGASSLARYFFTLTGSQDTTWAFQDVDTYLATGLGYTEIDNQVVEISATYTGSPTPTVETYRKVVRIKEPTTVITGFTQNDNGSIDVSWRAPLIDQQLLRVEVRLVGYGLNLVLPASDRSATLSAAALATAGLDVGEEAALDVVYFTPVSELAGRQVFTYRGTTTIPRAQTPTFTPVPGPYLSTQLVEISTDTPGAAIYYTIDGESPLASGLLYTGPLTVMTTTNIKAVALAGGMLASPVASAVFEINAPPVLTILTQTLPDGLVGVSYSRPVVAVGGEAPYTWSVIAGSLPSGFTLDGGTGVLTGTPASAGSWNFTVRVEDNAGDIVDRAYSLAVTDAPSITTSTLPSGLLGVAYSQTVAASGGVTPYAWSVATGSLPAGITLIASTGVITGTPSAAGTFNFTLRCTGDNTLYDEQAFSLVVTGPPTITTTTLPDGTLTIAYSQTVAATSGVTPYAWTITGGALPSGLTLDSSTGAITGTPTTTGTANFTARATGANGLFDEQALSITVTGAPTINTTTLPGGVLGQAYDQTVAATGGTTPYAWTLATGSLPAGLTLNGSTGQISGTPTTIGTENFTVRATGGNTLYDDQALSIAVADSVLPTPVITPTPTANFSGTLLLTFTVANPTATIYFTLDGTTPTPLNNAGSGQTGRQLSISASYTVKAAAYLAGWTESAVATATYTHMGITTTSLPSGYVGVSYSQPILVTGSITPNTWSIVTGSMPSGLSIDPSTGVISGTPTTVGTWNITFRCTGANAVYADKFLTIRIDPAPTAPTITTTTLPDGSLEDAYSTTLAATGGTPPYAWWITTGTLPSGITLSSDGVLSGASLAEGTFTFTVRMKDSLSLFDTQTLSLTIIGAPTITTDTLANAVAGAAYSATVQATGGMTPYEWSFLASAVDDEGATLVSNVPAGLTIDSATGVISGTPTTAGTYSFWVRCMGNNTWGTAWWATLVVDPGVPGSPFLGIERVSVSTGDAESNGDSLYPFLSADGRYVAFTSASTTFATPNVAGINQVFLRDRQTGTTERISVSTGGALANSYVYNPSVSADGRFVAFSAEATNLVAGDTNGVIDIFLRDRTNSTTARVTVSTGGAQANAYSDMSKLSDDGKFLVFRSFATNLVTGDTNGTADVFLRDLDASATTRISVGPSGVQANASSFWPALSANGERIVFGSFATNLVTGDTNGFPDIFVHERTTGLTTRVNVATNGTQANDQSSGPAISGDGNMVAFSSLATSLVAGDTNAKYDVFVRNLTTGVTRRVSVSSSGEQGNGDSSASSLSYDGRYVTFTSTATNLTVEAQIGYRQAYRHDLTTGETILLSMNSSNVTGDDSCDWPTISQDGSTSAFNSRASNLIADDANGRADVFVSGPDYVANPPVIDTATVPNAFQNVYYQTTLVSSGGGAPHIWSLTSGTAQGMSYSPLDGSLSGTCTTPGDYTFTMRATGTDFTYDEQTYTLTCVAGPSISTTSFPNGTVGTAYSQTPAASGGATPYTWAASVLPPGLSLDSSTGAITGTPTLTGTVTFYLRATGADTAFTNRQLSITIDAAPTAPTITTTSFPAGIVGTAYAQTPAATGGVTPYTWAISSGSLPTGLNLNTSTGELTGTPSAAGDFTFDLRVISTAGPFSDATFTIAVTGAPTITTADPLPSGTAGTAYSQTLLASGGTTPFFWWIVTGTPPAGVSLTSGGVLSGTPSAAGDYSFSVRVNDANSLADQKTFSLTIGAAPTAPVISTTTLPAGVFGQTYTTTISASGGSTPYAWTISAGTPIDGVTLGSSSGQLSGVPSGAGTYNFTVRCTGANALYDEQAFTVTISGVPTIQTTSLPDGAVGAAYSQNLSAIGATTPYSWTLATGSLPDGLSLSTGGAITGTPTTTGAASFSVRCTGANGLASTMSLTLDIGVQLFTERVNVSSAGAESTGLANSLPRLSDDGRYVVFSSRASTLVTGDTNNSYDVFVRDRLTGQTTRVSVASDGTEALGDSTHPSISGDGRYVAFDSTASNLVADDGNGVYDVFVHDRQTGTTSRVSLSSAGAQLVGSSLNPMISRQGTHVVFTTYVTGLGYTDTNGSTDVFVKNLSSGALVCASVSTAGTATGNGGSIDPVISGDGRYVAFASSASDLVPADTNAADDIFLRDMTLGTTTRVSVASAGTQSNNSSFMPSLSADGQSIVFHSSATNLVADDTNATQDVFLHKMSDGSTTRISVGPYGSQTNGHSTDGVISGNGGYVTFASGSSNIVVSDTNAYTDIFVRDLAAGNSYRASVSGALVQGNGVSTYPGLSYDGAQVVFQSTSTNLVANDTNDAADVFTHGLALGVGAVSPVVFSLPPRLYTSAQSLTLSTATSGSTIHYTTDGSTPTTASPVFSTSPISLTLSGLVTVRAIAVKSGLADSPETKGVYTMAAPTGRVNVTSAGAQTTGSLTTPATRISDDGRFVVFASPASNVVTGDTNGYDDVFLHDRLTGRTTLVSVASNGAQGSFVSSNPSISGNGRYVAFESGASNLVAGDTNGANDVFVFDTWSGSTQRVSITSLGAQTGASEYSQTPIISRDGTKVAFATNSGVFDARDTNGSVDVYVRDLTSGTTTLVSVNLAGTNGGNGNSSGQLAISSDGNVIAFSSTASNLIAGGNATSHIYVRNVSGATTTRMSVSAAGTAGNSSSTNPALSSDGTKVAFQSIATNLVAGDTNATYDIFYRLVADAASLARLSVDSAGTQGNGSSQHPSFSGNGSLVVFDSAATNLVAGDTNSASDIFTWDLAGAAPSRISLTSAYGDGNGDSSYAAASYDGAQFVFASSATNFVANDTNGAVDVFTHGPALGVDAVVPVVFSIPPRIYTSAQTVTLSTATSDTSIYYTLNDTAPTASSTPYTGAINLPGGVNTVRAIAVKAGLADSPETKGVYTINLPLAITTTTLPSGDLDDPYSQTLAVTGGVTPYTWSIATGTLPTGVTLSAGGVLSGTPTIDGVFSFTARVTDSLSQVDTQLLTLTILGEPTITTTSLANGQVGVAYSSTISATGGRTPYAWSLLASGVDVDTGETLVSSFPPGLSINPTTGVFSGTPTTAGTYSFWIMCEGANLWANAWWATLTVVAGPSITNASLPLAVLNTAYAQGLTVSGGTSPYTWSIASGTLPNGVTLSGPSGALSGAPTELGAFPVTYRVTDALGQAVTRALTLTVSEPPVVGTSSLADGTISTAYSQTLAASKGATPYSWAIVTGSLPPSLALTNSTGEISGTPTTAGTYNFRVRCTASDGLTGERDLSITIVSGSVVTPKIGPVTGMSFGGTGGIRVAVTDDTPGATLYVTTNGTTPTTDNYAYTGAGPIEFSGGGQDWTIKAYAVKSGMSPSAVATANYYYLSTVGPTGTTFASATQTGTQINDSSYNPALSADARYVAFESFATNLDPTATTRQSEVYVKDRVTGAAELVSVNRFGNQASGNSYNAAISADGRYVAFVSDASDLVANDTNGQIDVFVRDLVAGTTTRASVSSTGVQGNGWSDNPAISGDGRFVAFESSADNLVAEDTNVTEDIFQFDRQTGTTTRVSVAFDGSEANFGSYAPSLNYDGRYLAFQSEATNLLNDVSDSNNASDIFVRDSQDGKVTRMSVDSDGTEGNSPSYLPSISADGMKVAFLSLATSFERGDWNSRERVFVSDTRFPSARCVSLDMNGDYSDGNSSSPKISADGNTVAFASNAFDLVPSTTNGLWNIYVRDLTYLESGLTTIVTMGRTGNFANSNSYKASISSDGRYVAYQSDAANLAVGYVAPGEDAFPSDLNGSTDVIVTDMARVFGDAYIEAEVRRLSGVPTGPLMPVDVAQISDLTVNSLGVNNLNGVQFLSHLDFLNLADNALTDITPIGALGKLTGLYINHNQISDLYPLSRMTGLSLLFAYNNLIDETQLGNIASLPNLAYISLDNNQIADATAFGPMTQLIQLSLERNSLTSIAPLRGHVFDYLNVSFNCIPDTSGLTATLTLMTEQSGACPVTFNDPILREQVELAAGVGYGDPLIYDQVKTITGNSGAAPVLNLSNLGITDLDGIGWLDGVPMMDLSGNPGVANQEAIGGMESLYDLKFGSSSLFDLGLLTTAANLERLSVPDNLIDDVSTALNLPLLANFDFSNNYVITAAPLLAHPALLIVDISDNCIMDTGEISNFQTKFGAGLTNTGQSGKCF